MTKKGNKTQTKTQPNPAQKTEVTETVADSNVEAGNGPETETNQVEVAPETQPVPEKETVPETDETNAPVEKEDKPSFEPGLIDKEDPIKRTSANSQVYKMAANTLKELTERLDVPALPNYRDDSVSKVYISLYREIVRCLNVEKTSDMTALANYVLKLIDEYPRVFGVRRVFLPLQHMKMSDRDLRFYEELFNVFIMVNTDGKMNRSLLETKFNGLLSADKSERFTSWVLARQA